MLFTFFCWLPTWPEAAQTFAAITFPTTPPTIWPNATKKTQQQQQQQRFSNQLYVSITRLRPVTSSGIVCLARPMILNRAGSSFLLVHASRKEFQSGSKNTYFFNAAGIPFSWTRVKGPTVVVFCEFKATLGLTVNLCAFYLLGVWHKPPPPGGRTWASVEGLDFHSWLICFFLLRVGFLVFL